MPCRHHRVKDVPGIMAGAEAVGVIVAAAIDTKEEFVGHHSAPVRVCEQLMRARAELAARPCC